MAGPQVEMFCSVATQRRTPARNPSCSKGILKASEISQKKTRDHCSGPHVNQHVNETL